VVVEDFDPPHSDRANEKCLENFGVESLDWHKEDLCPETICNIGDDLRDISLRWSGKNVVLRGWSEPEGLVMCPELRLINLEYDRVRTLRLSSDFWLISWWMPTAMGACHGRKGAQVSDSSK